MRALQAWQQAEGGSASFNPLNTTQPSSGAGNYNSVGVKVYKSAQQGIHATAQTLLNGHYGSIVGLLRSGTATAEQIGTAVAHSPWGTGGGVLRVLGSGPVQVPGSPAAPPGGAPGASGAGGGAVQALQQQALKAMATASLMQPGGPSGSDLLSMAIARKQATEATKAANAGPPPVVGTPTSATGAKAVKDVHEYLGVKYQWGGTSPKGFDCSGLLQYVWAKEGVHIPRTTYDQFKAGKIVPKNQLRPGDAVFFAGSDAKGNLPGHVGMYIGNGQFVEAPHTGSVVKISNLAGRTDFRGGRRYA
jgi:cell wall-associated NlpC family hydrolase